MNRIKEQIDRELSSVTFESIDKERLEIKLSHTRKDKRMKLNKKFLTGVAAAVAGVTVLTVSVGAATGWDYGRLVRGFFGREDVAQEESDAISKLENVMQEIPADSITNTFTNYDASFDGVICDGNAMMVSVTLRSKDGTPFIAEEDGRISRYSGFFKAEGIEKQGGSEWCKVREDGSLQCMRIWDDVNITEKTNVKISWKYLLCNADVVKEPDISELDPNVVLDPGVLSAEIELDVCNDYKNLELTTEDGQIINVHVTPISICFTYEPGTVFADGSALIHANDIVIYGKDGSILVDPYEYTSGVGDETGKSVGMAGKAFYRSTFAKVIDVDEIGGMTCMEYSFGEVPAE